MIHFMLIQHSTPPRKLLTYMYMTNLKHSNTGMFNETNHYHKINIFSGALI